MSCEPNRITSEPAQNVQDAKAKLMFTALIYIDNVLRYRIVDLNHDIRDCIKNHINQFDHRMELVWRCGWRMERVGSSCKTQLERVVEQLVPKSHQMLVQV